MVTAQPAAGPARYLATHAPGPNVAIHPSIRVARGALDIASRDLLAIGDSALEGAWDWDGHGTDVRYGCFRAIEATELATATIHSILDSAGVRRSMTALRISRSTSARWELHGRLAPLDDALLDRLARDGEWTLRQTLGHIVGGQRGYVTFTAFHRQRNSSVPPSKAELAQIELDAALPDDADEALGSIDDIRGRLDETVDLGAEVFGGMPDEELARPARWSGIPVDVGFRIGRWPSHLMEHAIQIEKTLDWLDWHPTEVQRIVADLFGAWGRLELPIFPLDAGFFAQADADGRSVESTLVALGEELVSLAKSVREAAGA
ncbi:MAG TPA: DinB family protein [Candidatus Limnocylindrales bacterium]|nr:DinB family protein [Candidatus Limnocylindrales bacterium]